MSGWPEGPVVVGQCKLVEHILCIHVGAAKRLRLYTVCTTCAASGHRVMYPFWGLSAGSETLPVYRHI